jgi:hypothetical protein
MPDEEDDNLLKRLLHDGAVIGEATRHKATEDKVKGFCPCPVFLQVVDLVPVSRTSLLPCG